MTTEPTTSSGFHKIILGPPANRTDWFGVNVDTQESDLTALRLDDLRNDILPGIDFRYLTEWEEAVESENEKIRVASTGTPLARWFLVAAAALLVVEQLMAWHFVAGASLLAAMVSAVMVSNVWKIHWSFGAILLAITVIALVMVLNRFRSAVRI